MEVMERRRREAEEMSRSAPRVAARVGVAPQEAASVRGSPRGAAQSSSAAGEKVRRPAALTAALLGGGGGGDLSAEAESWRSRGGERKKAPGQRRALSSGTAALSIPPTASRTTVRGSVGGAISVARRGSVPGILPTERLDLLGSARKGAGARTAPMRHLSLRRRWHLGGGLGMSGRKEVRRP